VGQSRNEADYSHYVSGSASGYNVHYKFSANSGPKLVRGITLGALMRRYGDILWEPGFHKYNVTAFIAELDALLGGAEFSTFTDQMLDDLIGALRKRGNSNATINRKMAALSKLLRKACKMGEVHSLPEFRRQKERAGRIRFLEADEEARLFSAIADKSEHYEHLCIFLVDTGARIGEAIRLRWGDVVNGRATFWITKSGRSRSVPLTRRALAAVEAEDRSKPGPFSDVDQPQFRAAWNKAKLEVGLGEDSDVVPHVLRHTCASRLVRGGVDMRRVQTWLGHQTLAMTMRYAHLSPYDLDMCVPVLEDAAKPKPRGT
jgi:integrase